MSTAPTRDIVFEVLGTSFSYILVSWFCLWSPILVSASFGDRFRKPFWLVLGSTFGAVGGQKVTNVLSSIDAKIGIAKIRFRCGLVAKGFPVLVARTDSPYKNG